MSQYIGSKVDDAVRVPCTAPAVDDVLAVDPTDPKKGVWQKAGTNNIANGAINNAKVATNAAIVGSKLAGNSGGPLTYLDGSGALVKAAVKDTDATPVADRYLTVRDGKLVVIDDLDAEGRFVKKESLEVLSEWELGNDSVKARTIAASAVTPRGLLRDTDWGFVPNGDFESYSTSSGTEAPPDGWELGPSTTWDTDVRSTSGQSVGLEGNRAIAFQAVSGTKSIVTDVVPVAEGKRYRWRARWKGTTTSATGIVVVYWYQSDKSTSAGSNTVVNGAPAANDTYQQNSGVLSAPTNARYAKIAVGKGTATVGVTFDKVEFEAEVFGYTPVGSIMAWHKSFTGTPTLPPEWAECNGQTLSDIESPYNGQVIPDLNGSTSSPTNNRFLRGATTSGSLRNDNVRQHAHGVTDPGHTHTLQRHNNGGAGPNSFGKYTDATENDLSLQANTSISGVTNISIQNYPTSAGSPNETYPRHMDVVWIMRVK